MKSFSCKKCHTIFLGGNKSEHYASHPKLKPGRPKGSKNKPTYEELAEGIKYAANWAKENNIKQMNKVQYELSNLRRPEYIDDIKRIVRIAFEHGIILTLREAEELWEEYSNATGAGWLILPEKDEKLWDEMIENI